MNEEPLKMEPNASTASSEGPEKRGGTVPEWRKFAINSVALTVAFGFVWFDLIKLALHSELHNHLLLIPFISICIWRFIDPPGVAAPSRALSQWRGIILVLGWACFGVYLRLRSRGGPVTEHLWLGVLAYLLSLWSIALWTVGAARLKEHAFALGFLVFFIPLPLAVTDFFSVALQHGSAELADWTLRATGLPVLREGMDFRLPGLTVRVAEECSGVRSTLGLFIFSLVAGKMFLRSPGKRWALALATIPLGLLRNAVRITVISWLTVNVDRGIINGPIHHQGGLVLFPLSLVPLFVLMWWFRKTEAAKSSTRNKI